MLPSSSRPYRWAPCFPRPQIQPHNRTRVHTHAYKSTLTHVHANAHHATHARAQARTHNRHTHRDTCTRVHVPDTTNTTRARAHTYHHRHHPTRPSRHATNRALLLSLLVLAGSGAVPQPQNPDTAAEVREWRAIPLSFALIGFAKAGTTELIGRLENHPEVVLPPPEPSAKTREDHFWSRHNERKPKTKEKRAYAESLLGLMAEKRQALALQNRSNPPSLCSRGLVRVCVCARARVRAPVDVCLRAPRLHVYLHSRIHHCTYARIYGNLIAPLPPHENTLRG